jgi:maltose alpha-D-glucosyltransferase/alpha-amylase
MDPVYGYQSVNVEAQSRSPGSLINWMRKLINVRQGYRAFGRGKLEFLKPSNRKVIAYTRSHEGEVVLCIANLARSAQQVALDLSEFKGRVPVEMVGWSSFQTIGGDRYVITLPGHGFYWFLLSETAQAPSWGADLPGQLPELTTLVLQRDGAMTQLGSKVLTLFENDVLPAYLPKQRWFSDKDAKLEAAQFVDTARFESDRVAFFLTLVDAANRYFVPVAIVEETSDAERPAALTRATLARTRTGPSSGFLVDAFAVDAFATQLLADVRAHASLPSIRGGKYVATPTDAFLALETSKEPRVRRMDVEQSNTSLVIDERFVLKGYRKIQAGPQPELEVARFLASVDYRSTPALYGSLEYVAPDGSSTTLAIVQQFVECQGDAWATTLAYLERFFERSADMAPTGDTLEPPVPADLAASEMREREAQPGQAEHRPDYHEIFLRRARTLGIRTAELHRAFATSTGDPSFEPEPVTQNDLDIWLAQARAGAEKALDTLAREIERVPADLRAFAESLVAAREDLYARLHLPPAERFDIVKTRYHGDYHLAQVLVVADDFMLVDFEGEPGRPLAERRRKSSPLRDVAGMLRSINYVAVAAMRGASSDRAENTSALEPLAHDWERRSVEAYLAGYRETIAGTRSYPNDPAMAQALLDLFILEKAFYEMSYELANRPAWVRIPLEGIRSIVAPSIAQPEPAGAR